MRNNKSKPYGYYGGVTKENHYIPPPSPPFIPHPASVPFYENQIATVTTLLTAAESTREFLKDNEGIIMRRYLVNKTETEEFYEIRTLDNPKDVITYTTTAEGAEDLTLMDGGTF
jgi:hypothetical protein